MAGRAESTKMAGRSYVWREEKIMCGGNSPPARGRRLPSTNHCHVAVVAIAIAIAIDHDVRQAVTRRPTAMPSLSPTVIPSIDVEYHVCAIFFGVSHKRDRDAGQCVV